MYVVCLLFYAIGGWLFVSMFVLIDQMWSILFPTLASRRGDGILSNFACLQLRLKEGEDISGTLVIKCGIILQQALVCI